MFILFAALIAAGLWWMNHTSQAEAVATGDTTRCWTATCRDAVLQRNYDRSTGRK
jgi:hypothetical protein